MDALRINRTQSVRFVPDPRRVITKLFMPGDEVYRDGSSRLEAVLERIMVLTEDEVVDTLAAASALFPVATVISTQCSTGTTTS